MRRLLLALLAVVPMFASAQFTTAPGGYTTEDGKGFFVYQHEGTQAELYKKVKTAITTLFASAKSVMSESEPEAITVNGAEEIQFKLKGIRRTALIDYVMVIQFKDGRVRFDAPSVQRIIDTRYHDYVISMHKGKSGGLSGNYNLYDEDGELRDEKIAEAFVQPFNTLVAAIISKMDAAAQTAGDDDW